MTGLSKTASVLNLDSLHEGAVTFSNEDVETEDPTGRLRVHSIDRGTWDDLGRPLAITVTVEPGNTLEDL
ncbi:MAG: hypothetical protein H7288_05095 [Kineosporiaceae bacterium]|nr:hypothetical protein [Aeromicrobium sp.]